MNPERTPENNGSAYDELLEHEYDGIREYDNPLPPWWVWLWVGSMFFSTAYVMWYHLGDGPTVEAKYEVSVSRAVEAQLAHLGEITGDDATILTLMSDDKMMDAIGGLFRGRCAQCHGNEGGGNIGPNLTDDLYKSVESPADIYSIIAEGIPGTSMPAWGQRLREPQMILLASYVAKLRGTSPSGSPKEPEGVEIASWDTFAPAGALPLTSEASESASVVTPGTTAQIKPSGNAG